MARMDRDDAQPQLVPTGTRVSWRKPALIVAALLVGLVGLTRLGSSPPPVTTSVPTTVAQGPTASPPPSPTVRLLPTPTSAPITQAIVRNRLSGVMRRSPDGLSYADGIPTGISGESVYRVRDALLVPVGRTMLVGGWYLERPCPRGGRCPSPTLSDVALIGGRVGDVTTDFVALDTRLRGTGAHIVLATVEADPTCAIFGSGDCQPRLRVLQPIWSV